MTPPSLNTALKQDVGETRPSWDVADFDCFIEYTLPNAAVIKNIMSDPDWAAALKDQDDWVDVPKALVSLGYSTTYLRDGKPVN